MGMSAVILGAVQMACGIDRLDNIARAETWLRRAASAGATLVVLPELSDLP